MLHKLNNINNTILGVQKYTHGSDNCKVSEASS